MHMHMHMHMQHANAHAHASATATATATCNCNMHMQHATCNMHDAPADMLTGAPMPICMMHAHGLNKCSRCPVSSLRHLVTPPQVLAGMEMFKGLNSTEREKLIDNLQESIALALALALTLTLTRTCRRAQP